MNAWRPYPLLRLMFPFYAGIILEISLGTTMHGPRALLAFLFLFLVSGRLFSYLVRGYRYRWINGILVNAFFITAGWAVTAGHRPSSDAAWIGRSPEGLFLASMDEPPSLREKICKGIARVRYRYEGGMWKKATGKALAYLQVHPGEPVMQYGDFILLKAGFGRITDNSNPHGFSYAAWLENKGVTHRVYAGPHEWAHIGIPPSGFVQRSAFCVRDRLLDILRSNHVGGREFAVASALLLGYVDEIDAGLRKDYAATGAMHILSVSGMHVGIIYLFLEFLLGFLNRSRAGRIVKAITLLVFIWFYALLTGLSPCVLRSAAMLSLPILGKSLSRSPDIFNMVAASVLFILFMDPYLVTDVGFQLSYLAVAGIILLYKPVYDLYVTSSWLPDKIWSLLSVSIAAQLATLPITLYTFHQFPNYFMLTNIFVVPLSSLIIYFGIFTLVVGTVPVVSIFAAKVLVVLVWLLNTVIHFIEELPWSTTRGIYISAPEMLLLYVCIAACFLFFSSRRTPYLWIFLVVMTAFGLLLLQSRLERLKSSRFTVFNAPRSLLVEFSCQDRASVFYTTRPLRDWSQQTISQDIVKQDLDAHGIKIRRYYWSGNNRKEITPADFVPVRRYGNYFQFQNHRILLLTQPVPRCLRQRLCVDILVVTGNPSVRMADVFRVFQPGFIVIDATNSRYRAEKWLAEARKMRVPIHIVTKDGAFEKEF